MLTLQYVIFTLLVTRSDPFLGHFSLDFAKLVDLSTLRKLSPSFVKPEGLRQRHGDWLVPDASPALGHVLGLQMRRKYILADLKTPKFLDLPADNRFSVLAEWESARWTEDAVRLVELWRRATESGDSSIVRGFDALRQQTDSWLRIPEIEPGAAALPGRRKTMIRHEETWLAELSRVLEEPSDSDRTEGLARAIIECATATEFIARAREL